MTVLLLTNAAVAALVGVALSFVMLGLSVWGLVKAIRETRRRR